MRQAGWAHQYTRLKCVAMNMPGPHLGQTLRRRCTLPESSTYTHAGSKRLLQLYGTLHNVMLHTL